MAGTITGGPFKDIFLINPHAGAVGLCSGARGSDLDSPLRHHNA
jgi:hypothetical protein